MGEWRQAKLGELVSFKTGKLDSNAAAPNGTYPFFTCSQETLRTNTFSFNTECVLLAGNNANGIYPLKYFHGKFDAYQRTYVLVPHDTTVLLTRFLYYALRPKLSEFRSFSTGAATKFLTRTILDATEIPLPLLPIQRRIAGILSAYDDLIESCERRIRVLDEMARALYREWFVLLRYPGHEKTPLVDSPLGRIPKGWEYRGVKDLATVTYGYPFASSAFSSEPTGTPVVRIRDILDGESRTYTTEPAEPRYLIKPGDILIGMDGDFHMCVWWNSPALQNQRVARFEPVPTWATLHFFLALQPHIQALNKAIVGTTVAHLGDMHLKRTSILSPDDRVLSLARSAFQPLGDESSGLRRRIGVLRQTRDLLLPRLLSGQLSVEEVA